MPVQIPTVGRIVHYQRLGMPGGDLPAPWAAIITQIGSEQIAGDGQASDLAILAPFGTYHYHGVPFAETPTGGHWNWPPRD